ncbi:MAG: type VI secretion IcmF C-terminal domain-containing protein, partial [Brucella intermedia]
TLDSDIHPHTQPLVDTPRSPRRRRNSDKTSDSDSHSLRMIEQGKRIREAFFRPGQEKPSLNISLQPTRFAASSAPVMFELSGERVVFRSGDDGIKTVTWPADKSENTSRFTNQTNGLVDALETRWDWSAYRLLEQARISSVETGAFEARFKTGKQSYDFQVQLGSFFDPATLVLFTEFQCPADF